MIARSDISTIGGTEVWVGGLGIGVVVTTVVAESGNLWDSSEFCPIQPEVREMAMITMKIVHNAGISIARDRPFITWILL